MKTRKIVTVVLLLPFLVILPHWGRVLWDSPVDRSNLSVYGPIALVLAIAAAVKAWKTWKSEVMSFYREISPFSFVLPSICLLVFFSGLVLRIWLIAMAGAVVCVWFALLWLFGWRLAAFFLPALIVFLPTVPGVLFWGGRASALCVASKPCSSCQLELSRLDSPGDGWLTRKTRTEPGELALFRTAKIEKRDIAVDETIIKLMEVSVGSDVHEVHPLSFCLKSRGETAVEEKIVTIRNDAGWNVDVLETIAGAAGRRNVVWTWYTDERESTASFVRFRLKVRPGWKRYTLIASDTEQARKGMKEIIIALRK